MDHGPNDIRNPGEARNRARQRRKWAFLIFAGLVGAVIGALLSGLENGEGNFPASQSQQSRPRRLRLWSCLGNELCL